ncbi:lysophospholipase [Myxococcota bacterium]|nr:lysophospholipase [Myxococcota bacterium]
MTSPFDSPRFSRSLFFPMPWTSSPPPGAEDRFVDADGVRLHVRVYAGDAPQTVLLFHGNGETVADYDALAPAYAHAGARLAVMDYRGYGASTGVASLRTCLDDAPRALDAVRAAVRGPIVVMGRSLGGACAAELAKAPRPRVVGYLFESSGAFLERLVARRGLALERPLDEDDLATFCPRRKVARCVAPALVLHGAADDLIEPDEAEALFGALGSRDKSLVFVDGAGHNDLTRHAEYWAAMQRFFAHTAGVASAAGVAGA